MSNGQRVTYTTQDECTSKVSTLHGTIVGTHPSGQPLVLFDGESAPSRIPWRELEEQPYEPKDCNWAVKP